MLIGIRSNYLNESVYSINHLCEDSTKFLCFFHGGESFEQGQLMYFKKIHACPVFLSMIYTSVFHD